ncbi:MAG: cell wall metabolism sensor histidine kinase WalK, partial [Alphaproteobacteria bacterium]|nr:cell wall metabolism sensor histidine kinase WalK [Alphaproteobacteria bacterium]
LAIAAELVEAHGGRIELLDLAAGEGAHFRITLPGAARLPGVSAAAAK